MGVTLQQQYALPGLASLLTCLVFELFDTVPVGATISPDEFYAQMLYFKSKDEKPRIGV
jgi:hypothetical protein